MFFDSGQCYYWLCLVVIHEMCLRDEMNSRKNLIVLVDQRPLILALCLMVDVRTFESDSPMQGPERPACVLHTFSFRLRGTAPYAPQASPPRGSHASGRFRLPGARFCHVL